jgi:hypothetical protein
MGMKFSDACQKSFLRVPARWAILLLELFFRYHTDTGNENNFLSLVFGKKELVTLDTPKRIKR